MGPKLTGARPVTQDSLEIINRGACIRLDPGEGAFLIPTVGQQLREGVANGRRREPGLGG